ncbi:hypothetical protein EfmAA610_33130 (plasmid) [Enterococcus faecium]|nr:hypothetical protein EfmAA610_33130 [Enterococcus faecium]
MNHFKGKQFQQDVIIVAVGYYLRYNLSYREVQEILYDRGINVSHTTIKLLVENDFDRPLMEYKQEKFDQLLEKFSEIQSYNTKILEIICIEPSMQMV